jgi:hypothetical protein
VTHKRAVYNPLFVTQKRKPALGRPKVPEEKAKGKWISVRFSTEEAEEIRLAAKASGKRKSKWVRETLLSASRNVSSANG